MYRCSICGLKQSEETDHCASCGATDEFTEVTEEMQEEERLEREGDMQMDEAKLGDY